MGVAEITCQGEAPFHLPITQFGSLRGDNHAVEMIVFASVEGKGPHAVPLRLGFSENDAQALIIALTRAVREAQTRRQ